MSSYDIENACKYGDLFYINLIENFDWNKTNIFGETYLDISLRYNQLETVKLLLKKGATLYDELKYGDIMYQILVEKRTKISSLIKKLFKTGVNLQKIKQVVNKYGNTNNYYPLLDGFNIMDEILYYTCLINDCSMYEILKYLLNNGSNPNKTDINGNFPLFFIIRNIGNKKANPQELNTHIEYLKLIIDLFIKYRMKLNIVGNEFSLQLLPILNQKLVIIFDQLKNSGMNVFYKNGNFLKTISMDVITLSYIKKYNFPFTILDIKSILMRLNEIQDFSVFNVIKSFGKYENLFDNNIICNLLKSNSNITLKIIEYIIQFEINVNNILYYIIESCNIKVISHLFNTVNNIKLNDECIKLLSYYTNDIGIKKQIFDLFCEKLNLYNDCVFITKILLFTDNFEHESCINVIETAIKIGDIRNDQILFDLFCKYELYNFANTIRKRSNNLVVNKSIFFYLLKRVEVIERLYRSTFETIKIILEIDNSLINERDENGYTCLHLVCKQDCFTENFLRLILSYQPNLKITADNKTALDFSIENLNMKFIDILCE